MIFKGSLDVLDPTKEAPDSISIAEFMLDEKYGRRPFSTSRNPMTCGITGRSHSTTTVRERVDYLSRALTSELGWHANEGTEWDKVATILSVNAIDIPAVSWAVHRLSGVVSPASAAYSEAELTHQLISSGAKCIFTCESLLHIAVEAGEKAKISRRHIYLLDTPPLSTKPRGSALLRGIRTVGDLIEQGRKLKKIEALQWNVGQGAQQIAYLCFSSGTSGLPKGVKISHRNVIANILAITAHESTFRRRETTRVCLGVLPQSHIYGIVLILHASIYRGDEVVILPKYDFQQMLSAIQQFSISTLFLVPPIILAFLANRDLVKTFDLHTVDDILTGAAPLGAEIYSRVEEMFPRWKVREGYGLTETAACVATTKPDDIWLGSVGALLPSIECRLLTPEGIEVEGYDNSGELWVRSPSVTLGYFNNDRATAESFQNGWHRTGDEALFRVSPNGKEHLFIIDRIKELIKVKGNQVAPAELEEHLLLHPVVAEAAVIPVYDADAGEVPKAFIVKASSYTGGETEVELAEQLEKHVRDHKSRVKWLTGGVEFVTEIPRSTSGKIMRRLLRDMERERRARSLSKL